MPTTADKLTTVVFVHGWSVTSTDTYGQLPERLVAEAKNRGWAIDARHVFLGKYVSFRDEVTVDDLARAFESAVRRELKDVLATGGRFACITHSTGGPVVRLWWHRFYQKPAAAPPCPLSHLIMLAPANFGSALGQLGKERLGKIDAWRHRVEPGVGVLNWLELGSPEAWTLNRAWIAKRKNFAATNGVYPFVLTGQAIDRKFYDHVNSYTGEPGSDGVVRVAAANLNATYVQLVQQSSDGAQSTLTTATVETSPDTAFKIVSRRSHSGDALGILRSVKNDGADHPTVDAVVRCLEVASPASYAALTYVFATENDATQQAEHIERVSRRLLPDAAYVIDQFSMVIFRIRDDQDNAIGGFNLKLTGVPADARGELKASPDLLPVGFLQDRQQNKRSPETLTFFLNQDIMTGCPAVVMPADAKDPAGATTQLRQATAGLKALGLRVEPHLTKGFVHFVNAELEAGAATIRRVLKPNQTTLVDIVMRRVVREGAFRLQRLDKRDDKNFANDPAGDVI